MSGCVGVIASDSGRYTLFTVSLTQLHSPPNTALKWGLTSDRILGRNRLVEQTLEIGAEWLLFIDDDHVFGSDHLLRLLAHDKPVVGALYLQRQMPFAPVAFSHKTDDERYIPLVLTDYGPEDLVEVRALGTGGMLIRSEVFHAMIPPWFEHGRASEDIMFCDKVYELGLGPVYCDLGTRMGHMSPAAIWPEFDEEDRWGVGFSVADNFSLKVPISVEEEADTSESDPLPTASP